MVGTVLKISSKGLPGHINNPMFSHNKNTKEPDKSQIRLITTEIVIASFSLHIFYIIMMFNNM